MPSHRRYPVVNFVRFIAEFRRSAHISVHVVSAFTAISALKLPYTCSVGTTITRPSSAGIRATRTGLRASVEPLSAHPRERAFRLVQFPAAVELQTATYTLKLRPEIGKHDEEQKSRQPKHIFEKPDDVEVVLNSMVHLGDRAYYGSILREASLYDRVLFELIAGPEVSTVDADGRRAITDYVYPTREQVCATSRVYNKLRFLSGTEKRATMMLYLLWTLDPVVFSLL